MLIMEPVVYQIMEKNVITWHNTNGLWMHFKKTCLRYVDCSGGVCK